MVFIGTITFCSIVLPVILLYTYSIGAMAIRQCSPHLLYEKIKRAKHGYCDSLVDSSTWQYNLSGQVCVVVPLLPYFESQFPPFLALSTHKTVC